MLADVVRRSKSGGPVQRISGAITSTATVVTHTLERPVVQSRSALFVTFAASLGTGRNNSAYPVMATLSADGKTVTVQRGSASAATPGIKYAVEVVEFPVGVTVHHLLINDGVNASHPAVSRNRTWCLVQGYINDSTKSTASDIGGAAQARALIEEVSTTATTIASIGSAVVTASVAVIEFPSSMLEGSQLFSTAQPVNPFTQLQTFTVSGYGGTLPVARTFLSVSAACSGTGTGGGSGGNSYEVYPGGSPNIDSLYLRRLNITGQGGGVTIYAVPLAASAGRVVRVEATTPAGSSSVTVDVSAHGLDPRRTFVVGRLPGTGHYVPTTTNTGEHYYSNASARVTLNDLGTVVTFDHVGLIGGSSGVDIECYLVELAA